MTDNTLGMRSVSTSLPEDLFDEILSDAQAADRNLSSEIRWELKEYRRMKEMARRRDDIRSTVPSPSITIPNRADAPHRPYTGGDPRATQTWPPTSSPLSD